MCFSTNRSRSIFCILPPHILRAIAQNGTPQQRTAALQDAEQQAGTYKSPAPAFDFTQKFVDRNTPFFTKLKELTVVGFFTSEIGAKQVLEYNPMPMRYDGDYDFPENGREWSW